MLLHGLQRFWVALFLITFFVTGCASRIVTNKTAIAASGTAAAVHQGNGQNGPNNASSDPYLWLEEIQGSRARAWVRQQNAKSTAALTNTPLFQTLLKQTLTIYNSDQRLPSVTITKQYVNNFWRDAQHTRGIWRRTSLDEFRKKTTRWETVLDIDALAAKEKENWVFDTVNCLAPAYRFCMVALSRGGKDATVYREFDTQEKQFIPDGFFLAEAKSRVSWKDRDHLWVGTNFGPNSLTKSGYPRIIKEWKRGTPLKEAQKAIEVDPSSVFATIESTFEPDIRYDVAYDWYSFFRSKKFLVKNKKLLRLPIPDDASIEAFFEKQIVISLRSDWKIGGKTYPQGGLLATPVNSLLAGKQDFELLFSPGPRTSLAHVATTKNHLLLSTLENVIGRIYSVRKTDSGWLPTKIELPGMGQASFAATDRFVDYFLIRYEDFFVPPSLLLVTDFSQPVSIKSQPSFFDSRGMQVEQRAATSKDGTQVPYFVLKPTGFVAKSTNPTILYGYGGFQISITPRYRAALGANWVERGGVFVFANIRGGGEFGPRWHQAAIKSKRHKAFEDFIAIAEDLIRNKYTSPTHLGIMGGSNGGLLVGAVSIQRPDLEKAVVCQVPLLDMKRYNKLLAGASWEAEYGNPDIPAEWEFIRQWSPYQNLKKGVTYPTIFFTTSTKDDRVHPGHARKMAAKMLDMNQQVLYYENIEGGHAGAANQNQHAFMNALEMTFLWQQLR